MNPLGGAHVKALQTQSLFEKGTRRIPRNTGPVFPFNRNENIMVSMKILYNIHA